MKHLFIAVTVSLLATGCASIEPRTGENGEHLVFVKNIRGAGIPADAGALAGQAVAGPLAGGNNPVSAGLVGAVAGGVIQVIKGPQVIVSIYDHDTREEGAPKILVGHTLTLQRKPWPGVENLVPNSWAILALDEDGDKIVLPCPTTCAPK